MGGNPVKNDRLYPPNTPLIHPIYTPYIPPKYTNDAPWDALRHSARGSHLPWLLLCSRLRVPPGAPRYARSARRALAAYGRRCAGWVFSEDRRPGSVLESRLIDCAPAFVAGRICL